MYSSNARRNEASPNKMSLDSILDGQSTPIVRRKRSNSGSAAKGPMAVFRWTAGHPETQRRILYPDHEEGSVCHGGIRNPRRWRCEPSESSTRMLDVWSNRRG